MQRHNIATAKFNHNILCESRDMVSLIFMSMYEKRIPDYRVSGWYDTLFSFQLSWVDNTVARYLAINTYIVIFNLLMGCDFFLN